MYKVTVAGTYVISGRLAQIDSYEVEFTMAEGDTAKARLIIQNSGMLDEKLRKEKTSYKRWRTCQVIDIKNIGGETKKDVKELEDLLIEATELACMPVSYKSFTNDKLRKEALKASIKRKKKKVAKAKARIKGEKKGEE